jgi:uncharacterized protein YoxC
MQNTFQKALKNIKNKAGRGAAQKNFGLGTGAILIPKHIKMPSFGAKLTSGNLLTSNTQSGVGGGNKSFNVPKFASEFTSITQSRWVNLAFIINRYQYSQELNNQFVEPLNSKARGIFKHTPSMRDFGEISIYLSKETNKSKPSDIESLDKEIEFIKNTLSQEKVRLKHPRFGYINGAVSGAIKVDCTIVRSCIITFDFKEIQADLDDVLLPKPLTSKKASFFSKIKDTVSTIRDYTFATVAEVNNVFSKLDKLSGTLNKSAQTLNALQSNIITSLEPFNRLAHSINTFGSSIRSLLRFPDKLGSALKEIGNNFANINLSLKPSKKGSKESIQRNNANKQIIKGLLAEENFASNNSNLLSSKDEVSKSSYEALAITQQSYVIGLALFASEDIEFNTTEEIDDILKTVSVVASPLTQFQLYLGTDVYGNTVYHDIEFITDEIIGLIAEITTLYNDFLIRLRQLRQTLENRRSTIIKEPINMINLVRMLHNGEYNLQDTEEETNLINQICYRNKTNNFWFISGKIFY